MSIDVKPQKLTEIFGRAQLQPASPASATFDLVAFEEKLKKEAAETDVEEVSDARIMLELSKQPDVTKLLQEKGVDVEAFQRTLMKESSQQENNNILAGFKEEAKQDGPNMTWSFNAARNFAELEAEYNQTSVTGVDVFREMLNRDTVFLQPLHSCKIANVTFERIFPEEHAVLAQKQQERENNTPTVRAIREGMGKLEELLKTAAQQQSSEIQSAGVSSYAERIAGQKQVSGGRTQLS